MTIKGIELDTKWNEWFDTLYLWNGRELFVIYEGDKDIILDEDKVKGYKDCWLIDYYSMDLYTPDTGILLEKELITEADYTIQGVINRISQCELWDDDWRVLDEVIGKFVIWKFETFYDAKIDYEASKAELMKCFNKDKRKKIKED